MTRVPWLIDFFVRHKVAPNLLMLAMIFGGFFALARLNIQFFPNFALDIIDVVVEWSGASAEDMENDIVFPLEQDLDGIDHVKEITATIRRGSGSIRLEMHEAANVLESTSRVRQKIDEFRNLPDDAEEPEVSHVVRYERVANVLITGSESIDELRRLANQFKRELKSRGIDKVDIAGLPDDEVAIEISNARLQELRMNLDQIATRIGDLSRNIPAGTFGDEDNARELRSIEQRRNEQGFAELDIISDDEQRIELGAIATIERRLKEGGVTLSVDGQPAVELRLRRTENGDTLKSAEVIQQWLDETRTTLPPNINLHVYKERWKPIKDRIGILLKNGLTGLALVIIILYLFLNARVAFWVAVGIPVSFMAALLILKLVGGSINMISLFGLILTLGIIVDDAIVVGENAYSHFQAGDSPLHSAQRGAARMLAPVIASSMTTIAAFIPIMLLSGVMGNIMFDIPLVVIAVILASLFESFFVLPGHLRHAFVGLEKRNLTHAKATVDQAFERFKSERFRPLLTLALENRATTLSIACALMIVMIGLFAGQRIKFTFFPSPESSVINANVTFVPGTPQGKVDQFLDHLEQTARQIAAEKSAGPLIETLLIRHGTVDTTSSASKAGDNNLGSVTLELVDSDLRDIRNDEFIQLWRDRTQESAGIQVLSISSQEMVPDSATITIRVTGSGSNQVKNAAIALQALLQAQPDIYNVEDNMPYGMEQLTYRLTPDGEAMGLTTNELGRQLRTAFEGRLVQLYQDGPDEVEVRVRLPENERNYLNALDKLEIRLDSGETVPFTSVAEVNTRTGFSVIRHADGELAVDVSASIDKKSGNIAAIKETIKASILPEIIRQFRVDCQFAGRSADQAKTMDELTYGVFLGLGLIYLILAWIFSSYGWPLIVMSVIPFGLIGAVFGHLLLGLDITLMSMLGFFGLSGIVVNDSIILVLFFRDMKEVGHHPKEALVEAAVRRLRAVLLTSLTTIAGLIPLLFETSVQAQFLIPMAVSIAFGLAFSTFLVLILVPVLLSLYEDFFEFFRRAETRHSNYEGPPSFIVSVFKQFKRIKK